MARGNPIGRVHAARRKALIRARKSGRINIDIKVLGLKDTQRKFNQLRLGVQRSVLKKAVKQAAQNSLRRAVDGNIAEQSPGVYGVGKMKTAGSFIRVFRSKQRTQMNPWRWIATVNLPHRDKLDIEPDAAYYPAVLEHGGTLKTGAVIEPRRMLQNAQRISAAKSIQIMRNVIKLEINRRVRRLGRKKVFKSKFA